MATKTEAVRFTQEAEKLATEMRTWQRAGYQMTREVAAEIARILERDNLPMAARAVRRGWEEAHALVGTRYEGIE